MKMKYLIACLLVVTFGCKKDSSSMYTDQLQGTWELTYSYSGWGGEQHYETGNGNTFVFTGNSYVQKIKTADTTYTYTGTFRIYKGKVCEYSDEQTLFQTNNEGLPSAFTLVGGEMSINTPPACIADGGGTTYKKIQ